MSMSKDITIRFPLTKGEGDFPDISQFSENELHDLRTCLSLDIYWEPELMDENQQEAKIQGIEILYDGITHIKGESYGYWFEDNELKGYPAPIIRFFLNQAVDVEQFMYSIHTTSFDLITESIKESGGEPYFSEDYYVFISALSDDERDEVIEYLKSAGVFCGKKFSFPDGLEESGHFIPGTEFILPNSVTPPVSV